MAATLTFLIAIAVIASTIQASPLPETWQLPMAIGDRLVEIEVDKIYPTLKRSVEKFNEENNVRLERAFDKFDDLVHRMKSPYE